MASLRAGCAMSTRTPAPPGVHCHPMMALQRPAAARPASSSTASSRPTLRVFSAPDGGEPSTATNTTSTVAPEPAATEQVASTSQLANPASRQGGRKTKAESTDAIASFLSRRFGIAGGLAWLGFLAIGSLGEQVKTRMEVEAEIKATRDVADGQQQEVILPSGVRYTDVRLGGGQTPPKGYLVVVDFVAKADGVEFESSRARGKPIVFLFGGRPFTGGMCPGVEEAMSTMRAGGRRRIVVPAASGFGDRGLVLRPTEHVPEKQGLVPPGATLEYDLELVRVSIPPS